MFIAGMDTSYDSAVGFELRDHLGQPKYFKKGTDSWKVATILEAMGKYTDLDLSSILLRLECVVSRLRQRFNKPFSETVSLLMEEPHEITLEQFYDLYGKWDLAYGLDKRPKSDVVLRAIVREFKCPPPRCKWLDWDFQPLREWTYRRTTLEEVRGQGAIRYQLNIWQ